MNQFVDSLRLHGFVPRSRVNGPGLRSVVWVQGCERGCPGCFNQESHAMDSGTVTAIGALLAMVPEDVEGLTISGGEPFLQAAACAELARACRERGLTVLAYTGFTYQELLSAGHSEQLRFLASLDWLIDGEYRQDQPPTHPWAGSGNQRVIALRPERLAAVVEAAQENYRQQEILIAPDGTVTTTGF